MSHSPDVIPSDSVVEDIRLRAVSLTQAIRGYDMTHASGYVYRRMPEQSFSSSRAARSTSASILSGSAWAAALATICDEKTVEDFQTRFTNEGPLCALKALIIQIGEAVGLSWSMHSAIKALEPLIKAMESWLVLETEEALTNVSKLNILFGYTAKVSVSTQIAHIFRAGCIGVLASVVLECVRWCIHKISAKNLGKSATNEGQRAMHEREASRIFEMDNILRHVIQICTSMLMTPFVGSGAWAVLGTCVTVCLISHFFETSLKKKQAVGGWKAYARSILQAAGLVGPEEDRNYSWASADGDIHGLDRLSTVPIELCCPITGNLLVDPVLTPSGHFYSRRALEVWLAINATDPQTRIPLTLQQVKRSSEMDALVSALAAHLNLVLVDDV